MEYRYRDHYTKCLIFVPLMYFVAWYEVIRDHLNKWSFTRTEKIINHALPKILHINISDDSLYFTVDKYFWRFSWEWYCNIFDKYYCYKYDNRISEYFKDMFDLDGHTKSIDEDESTMILLRSYLKGRHRDGRFSKWSSVRKYS